jgi:hypothetical protein
MSFRPVISGQEGGLAIQEGLNAVLLGAFLA